MKKIILPFILICLMASCTSDRTNEIDRAMRHYDRLIQHLDADSIANQYLPDGELSGEGAAPVIGRDSISKMLKSFNGATVFKYESKTKSTVFKGDTAIQDGTYVQIVKIPAGDTLELGGDYTATWVKNNGQPWLLAKMYTYSYRNLKEERRKQK